MQQGNYGCEFESHRSLQHQPSSTSIFDVLPDIADCSKPTFTYSKQVTRYRQAEFEEDDNSSIGSIQLSSGVATTKIYTRYHRGTSLWKARSKLERVLLILTAVSFLFIFILMAILSSSSSDSTDKELCLTPACVTAAASMLTALDLTVDPCDDFYEYACGGWIRANPIPYGKSMWGTFGKLEQQNQLVIRNALEKDEMHSNAEHKARKYYLSCMDANETIETLGAEPLIKFLNEVGGWNITGNFRTPWSLQNTLQVLQNKYNMGGLFTWAVGEDDQNSDKHVIQIDQGGLTLPTRDSYLNETANEKVLKAYLEYMTKIGVLLGGEEASTRAQMSKIIELETHLAEISTPLENRRDEEKLYHNMNITELQNLAPFLDWHQYFSFALKQVNRKVSPSERVVVYAPEYLSKLSDIITNNYTNTKEGNITLNNYLVWQTVKTLTVCLSKAFRDAYKGLRKALIGSEGGEEPWRYCVADTANAIGFAVGAMFVREVFHGNSKPMAENMINEVRSAFKANLKNLAWMDRDTRKAAMRKADAISDMIGFPNYILNPSELDDKYKDVDFEEYEYFQNNIRVNIYNLKDNLEKLGQPVNKTRWSMTPPTVNAYYTPTKNQIVFPAGILQAPFYDTRFPPCLNFGGMGVVMGHELTHAFDDQGREYDETGNLHKWWNNRTIEQFKQRTDCVVMQYSRYNIGERYLNGKQTLGENIADNGGLKAAFHAYLRSPAGQDDAHLLPGLQLNSRQLFFLSFAQLWCSSSTQEAINLQIEKDPHSPSKFRVIGPLTNLPEFAREFGCRLGSKMNPIDKCEVW